MEFVILFFPILGLWRFEGRQQKAQDKARHRASSTHARDPSEYSLAALDRALKDDTSRRRLEEFAATRDFTGENIAFLERVGGWKEEWKALSQADTDAQPSPAAFGSLFGDAERIFRSLVHREMSRFPVNLDDDIYLALDGVFGGPDVVVHGCSSVHGFDGLSSPEAMIAPFADDVDGEEGRLPASPKRDSLKVPVPKTPSSFECGIFDKAELEVKQMVLTNTWIR
jgi:hypothetical protein